MVQDTMDLMFRQASSIDPISTQLVKKRLLPHIVSGIGKESFPLLVEQSHFEVDQISIPWGGLMGNGKELIIGEEVINRELFTRSSLRT